MLTGVDHAIIGLRGSASAHDLGEALGLVVNPGGEHPGWGTRNEIVRFGLDYVELLMIANPVEAGERPRGRAFLSSLEREEGWLGYALASLDAAGDAGAIRGRGLDVELPQRGARLRPGGSTMAWRTSRIAGSPWGSPLPFIIQHETPDEVRRGWVPAEGHPLGATRLASVAVAGPSLDSLVADYRLLLGRDPDIVDDEPALPARRAVFVVGRHRIELLEPASAVGGLANYVREHGPALFGAGLGVSDVDRAVECLRERGTAVGDPAERRATLLNPRQTAGARLCLVEWR